MQCRHVWTAWLTVRKVLGGIVVVTFARSCSLCGRHEDSSGEELSQAA